MMGIGNFTGRRVPLDYCQTVARLPSDTERPWHRQVILGNNQKLNVGVRHFAQKMCRLPPISNSLVEQLCQKISAFFVTPLLTTFIHILWKTMWKTCRCPPPFIPLRTVLVRFLSPFPLSFLLFFLSGNYSSLNLL